MTRDTLEDQIERHFAQDAASVGDADALSAFLRLRAALEAGGIRSAEPCSLSENPLGWRVNAWEIGRASCRERVYGRV